MRRPIVLLIVAALGWYGYKYRSYFYNAYSSLSQPRINETTTNRSAGTEAPSTAAFRCDGRIYCSQMTSCAEATYFLRNCPGVKMDGNNDGVPCERQWCRRQGTSCPSPGQCVLNARSRPDAPQSGAPLGIVSRVAPR